MMVDPVTQHHSHLCPVCKDRWDCADKCPKDPCRISVEMVCVECDPIGG